MKKHQEVFSPVIGWLKSNITRKRIAIFTGAAVLVVIIFQLAYPSDRAVLRATINEQPVSGWTKNDIRQSIAAACANTTVTVGHDGQTGEKFSAVELGMSCDDAVLADKLVRYPLALRLVPLSYFFYAQDLAPQKVTFDDNTLAAATQKIISGAALEPVSASVKIEGGKAVVVPAVSGVQISEEALQKTIRNFSYELGMAQTLNINGETVAPERTDSDVVAVKEQANEAISSSLNVRYGDKTDEINAETRASWLAFTDKNGALVLGYDSKKIQAYITKHYTPELAVAAGKTQITTRDGIEVSRKNGANGTAINMNSSVRSLATALLGNEVVATITTQTVAPTKTYSRSYSSSQRGLQAYANDLASQYDISIAVKQVGGNGWSAGANMWTQEISASTYKLFIAQFILEKVKNGDLKMTDSFNGSTVGACLERMIVNSENSCAEAWTRKYGHQTLDTWLHARGYSAATTFMKKPATQTSVGDLQKALADISSGAYIGRANSDLLLGYMKRQVYRQGVPAGTSATVADKVGFLWGYLNDAAIVYHPRGTYYISVITNNQSWGKIADITRQVERIMYP